MAGWHWGAIVVVLIVGLLIGKMYGSRLPLISQVGG